MAVGASVEAGAEAAVAGETKVVSVAVAGCEVAGDEAPAAGEAGEADDAVVVWMRRALLDRARLLRSGDSA